MSELSTTNSQPARTVEAVTLEIQTLQRQAQQLLLGYAIEIGRRLVEVKAMLPHGQWGTYIKEQVGYSQSTANNLMRIFEEYGTAQQSIFGPEAISQAIGNLSYTKALRLLALPADEREAFVEEHNVEDMSTRELEAAIKERDDALRRAEEDRAEREAAEQAREKIAQDMALANERVAQLSRELEELRSRPVEVAVQHAEEEELEQARREAAVILLKLLPQRYGQAAHIVKSFCQLHMHPVIKLFCPERFLSQGSHLCCHFFQCHGFYIFLSVAVQ